MKKTKVISENRLLLLSSLIEIYLQGVIYTKISTYHDFDLYPAFLLLNIGICFIIHAQEM